MRASEVKPMCDESFPDELKREIKKKPKLAPTTPPKGKPLKPDLSREKALLEKLQREGKIKEEEEDEEER
jgi:hypothetical protein